MSAAKGSGFKRGRTPEVVLFSGIGVLVVIALWVPPLAVVALFVPLFYAYFVLRKLRKRRERAFEDEFGG